MTLQQKKLIKEAIKVLEEAIKLEPGFFPVYFLLFNLAYQSQNYSQAKAYLEFCRAGGYQIKYVQKMLVKCSYKMHDFPAVLNYLSDFKDGLRPASLVWIVKIESLVRLQLTVEAEKIYRNQVGNHRISDVLREYLRELLSQNELNQYQICYLANQKFFRARDREFVDYEQVFFKVCRFLETDLVYHSETERIILAIEPQNGENQLRLETEDVLLIHNPGEIQVFEQLKKILYQVPTENHLKRITAIPVLIVEEELENWQLMMQLFDFNQLSEWMNLHFSIGSSTKAIEELFLDENLPLPNLLYGIGLDQLRESLEKVKIRQDELFEQRLKLVKADYCLNPVGQIKRILVITSVLNDSLKYYGQLLHSYLNAQGYQSILYTETAPYFKFTNNIDLKMLESFRPDLIIHFFAAQEELEVFKDLSIPYFTWLIFEKRIIPSIMKSEQQHLFVSGGKILKECLIQSGYPSQQISELRLPVTSSEILATIEKNWTNEVGIVANLGNLKVILENITLILYEKLNTKQPIVREELGKVFEAIYFEMYLLLYCDFKKLTSEAYREMISRNFTKCQLYFDDLSIQIITTFLRQELEEQILKLVQLKWITNEHRSLKLSIYGKGWERVYGLADFYEGSLNPLGNLELYQELVRKNKINLYIGSQINNASYLQPDLLNGIAAGGFFLVNDLLVKEYGESSLGSFVGRLITYQSKEDLLVKIRYYLEHESERMALAQELQVYVLNSFQVDKVFGEMLNKVQTTVLNEERLLC